MATDNTATETPESSGEFIVRSIQETEALAATLLPLLQKSKIVSLEGPLGAGKTHFVKATARALGIAEDVTSPTFTLLQSYGSGEKRLHHSDWYRLESEAEVRGLTLEDYYGEGLMLIEWGDKFPSVLPPETVRILIEPMADDTRRITVQKSV
jgi:tRNA threonylcarbamoyladenosine biosynthesis protein TsaE